MGAGKCEDKTSELKFCINRYIKENTFPIMSLGKPIKLEMVSRAHTHTPPKYQPRGKYKEITKHLKCYL